MEQTESPEINSHICHTLSILLLIEILVVYIFGGKMNKTAENILVHVCGGENKCSFSVGIEWKCWVIGYVYV